MIKNILGSRKYEVQTYRMCRGILGFKDKYGAKVLEDCCGQAIKSGKMTYTFVKNTVTAIAEEHGNTARSSYQGKRGGYVMDSATNSIENLLSRSRELADTEGKDGDSTC